MAALLKFIPAKAWLLFAALALLGGAAWKMSAEAERRARAEILTEILKEQADAEARAENERRRLDRGDDGGVRGFDRD